METIRERVFSSIEQLSPAEKRVARALLADYPGAGLGSASRLARDAGTSTPTVLRLVARLGLESWAELQDLLRREVSQRAGSPVSRAERTIADDGSTPFDRAVALRAEAARSVADTVPPSEFDAAIQAIVRANRVIITGGYFSLHIAEIMRLQLDQLRSSVHVTGAPTGRGAGRYFDLDRRSLAIIIDMRRHEETARRAVDLARARGARTVVITDIEMSPAAERADIVLPVHVDHAPFDTFVALMSLVECLVDGVFGRLGGAALERMRLWEQSVQIPRSDNEENAE